MGFFENINKKIEEYAYISKEKEKGKNAYLLKQELPKDATIHMIKGYENEKLASQRREINKIKMAEETEKLKIQQKLNKEKYKNLKIKNKLKKETGDESPF